MHVVARRGVDRPDAVAEAVDLAAPRSSTRDLHLLEEALGRHLLAVRQLDRGVAGEGRSPAPIAAITRSEPDDASLGQPVEALGDDRVELATHVAVVADAVAVAPAGDEEDRGGERGRALADRALGHLGVERPRLGDREAGAPQRLDEAGPAERRLVRVDADERRVRLEHPVRLGESRRHLVLVELARRVLVAVVAVRSDDRLAALRRQLAGEVLGNRKPTERFSQT